MISWNVWRCASSKHKEQSKKYKVGIRCADDFMKWFVLRTHSFRTDDWILTTFDCHEVTLWPRRESSRARPRPHLAFRRDARLLPSGWPRRESNPHLAFRKRLFYPLNYSANIYNLYSIIYTLLSLLSFRIIPITMPHQVISFQPVRENLHMLIFQHIHNRFAQFG